MFKITMHKGFHMTFENGVTVSVQWGSGNHCENKNDNYDAAKNAKSSYDCLTAEVAAWTRDGEWILPQLIDLEYDTVIGYQTTEDVLRIMELAKNYKA